MSTNRTNRIFPAAVAGALGVGAVGLGGVAHAGEPTTQDLMDQIQQLQAKVQQIEGSQTQPEAAAPASEPATVDSVLRDAEKRSQLLQDDAGLLAGHERGRFFLRSADGDFTLNPSAQFQFRHVANMRDDNEDDSAEKGFEVRRMRFELGGQVFTPDLTYFFQMGSQRNGGEFELQDAWINYRFADDWGMRLGQFKAPEFREELTSSKRQLAVDRSLTNELLGGGMTDRIQGVSLWYGGYSDDNPLNAEIAFHDGYESVNTDFRDPPAGNANFGVSARAEYLVSGGWRGYRDFSAMDNTDDMLVVGAGAGVTQIGDTDVYKLTADAQWENAEGLSLFGAILLDQITNGADSTNVGGVIQVGYLLENRWEPFARYSIIVVDDALLATPDAEDTFHELTIGANYYLSEDWGHGAKFTIDGGYLPNGSPVDAGGIGVLESDDDQFYLRAQFQLLI